MPAHIRKSLSTCIRLITQVIFPCTGPYNVVVCGNCGAKEKGGNQCTKCGKVLNADDGSVDLADQSVGACDAKGVTPALVR